MNALLTAFRRALGLGVMLACVTLPLGVSARAADGSRSVDVMSASTLEPAQTPADLVQPVLQNEASLEYPDSLLEIDPRPEGKVVVRFVVGVDGVPKELEIAQPVHPQLDSLALEAVASLRYAPATYKGQPVEVVIAIGLDIVAPVPPPPAPPEAPSLEVDPATAGESESEGAGDDVAQDQPSDSGPVRIQGELLRAGQRLPIKGATVLAIPAPEDAKPGKVRGAPLQDEEVFAWEVSTTTADDGRFELAGVPDGSVRLVFVAVGYERLEYIARLVEGELLEGKYFLRPLSNNPYRTVVEDSRDDEPEVTRRTISLEEINTIPGTQGDALKAIQNFPGIARAPFGSAFLVIRGSAPEDSATFLAYHEIPLLFHFGGITSVFNSDILKQIDFIPGNFDSRYGDALGGVVNVVPRKGRRDGFHGYVDSDIFDTGLLFEGPIKKGSFILSGRRSYIDAILPLALPDDAGVNFTLAPRYWDYQALFDYPVSGGDFTARAFGSDDRTVLLFAGANDEQADARDRFEQAVYFHRADLSYEKRSGPWEFLLTPSYLHSKFDVAAIDAFKFNLTFNTISTRAEIARRFSRRLKVRVGTESIATQFKIDVTVPGESTGGASDTGSLFTSAKGWRLTPALYSTVTIQATDRFTIFPGVRVTYYSAPINKATVDPRMRFIWNLADRTTLKGGVGLYSQAPTPQETNETFGNPDLLPETSMQASVGVAQGFEGDWNLEVTGFYKQIWDSIVATQALTLPQSGNLGPRVLSNAGIGRTYGAEVLLRKSLTRNFYAWLSYTLSRGEIRDVPGGDFSVVDFDQTHILTLIGSYKFPRDWQLGARFRLVSGNPTTPIVNGVFDSETGAYRCIEGARNSDRIKNFHQLDLRVDKRWYSKRAEISLYLDIQNAYNRRNVEFRNYAFNCQSFAPITGLPIIPSIGTRIEF